MLLYTLHQRFVFGVLLVVGTVLAAVGFAAAQQDRALGEKVKAAYLLNFGRYVTWPDLAENQPLGICIAGEDPFGPVLDRTAEGRRVQGHRVDILRITAGPPPQTCHILYLSPQLPPEEQDSLLREVATRPILTVGDRPDFHKRGGIVNFVWHQDTIRFTVNLVAARQAGLEISSRVLALAVTVHDGEL